MLFFTWTITLFSKMTPIWAFKIENALFYLNYLQEFGKEFKY